MTKTDTNNGTDMGTQAGAETELEDQAEERQPEQADGTAANGATGQQQASEELETLRAERDDYLDQLQRSRAEFINYRRRNEQERAQLRELITGNVISQFLPVVDDFERALDSLPEVERTSPWVTGMEMIQSKFLSILQRNGVEKITPLNEPFDPKQHEAVATEPGTSGSTVVEIYQPGYKIGNTLIRPAMVKTGDGVPPSGNGSGSDMEQPKFDA